MNKYQEATLIQAIHYARRGWHVFPCTYKKTPMTPNGFYDATTDEEQIMDWWEEHNGALIGIRTGKESGFWVVDLDIKNGKDGLVSILNEFGDAAEFDKDEWLYQRTATGGYHLCFKWEYEVSCAKDILSGVDVRGDGGYIIAAPSSIRVEGEYVSYEWKDITKEPSIAPEWARDIGSRAGERKTLVVDIQRAVEGGIPHGSRDDDLFSIAIVMKNKGVSIEATSELITILGERCKPPFTREEALAKVESAYSYDNEQPNAIIDMVKQKRKEERQ